MKRCKHKTKRTLGQIRVLKDCYWVLETETQCVQCDEIFVDNSLMFNASYSSDNYSEKYSSKWRVQ